MKMKFGAIVIDGRGKIGGHVASKNRSGAYLRTKVTPVNGRTSYQQNVRNIFGSLAQAWRGLTQEQRDSWNAAVAAYAKTDIFGDLRNPSGISLYQRLNNNLVQSENNALSNPPNPEAVGICSAASLSADNSTGEIMLTTSGNCPVNSVLKISATPALSAGKQFIKNELRTLAYDITNFSSSASIKSIYEAKFGAVGAVGSKITVQVTVINTNTGQAGVPSEVYAIVVA
jgi:hypothetical protein